MVFFFDTYTRYIRIFLVELLHSSTIYPSIYKIRENTTLVSQHVTVTRSRSINFTYEASTKPYLEKKKG